MITASRIWIAGLLMGIVFIGGCINQDENTKPLEKPAAKAVDTVVIQQMKFMPASITVNKGDTIVWINKDIVTHNVTEGPGKAWASSPLPPGAVWKMEALKSANYFCALHPVMKGSLTVKQ